jgi:6-pyruvoyltetrahydropterin/6-carboxytetrahydropterin synthase
LYFLESSAVASYEVRVRTRFEAAHHLTSYRGAEEPVHGHSWVVEAEVSGPRLNDEGYLVDFVELKTHLDVLAGRLHYRDINTVAPFDELSPTAENLARWFHSELQSGLEGATVTAVTVWEAPECAVTFRP